MVRLSLVSKVLFGPFWVKDEGKGLDYFVM